MGNKQVLTTKKVVHQTSKLKPNKIKLDADERVGEKKWGKKPTKTAKDMNWYFHYLPYLGPLFECMTTHILT